MNFKWEFPRKSLIGDVTKAAWQRDVDNELKITRTLLISRRATGESFCASAKSRARKRLLYDIFSSAKLFAKKKIKGWVFVYKRMSFRNLSKAVDKNGKNLVDWDRRGLGADSWGSIRNLRTFLTDTLFYTDKAAYIQVGSHGTYRDRLF